MLNKEWHTKGHEYKLVGKQWNAQKSNQVNNKRYKQYKQKHNHD